MTSQAQLKIIQLIYIYHDMAQLMVQPPGPGYVKMLNMGFFLSDMQVATCTISPEQILFKYIHSLVTTVQNWVCLFCFFYHAVLALVLD